MESIVAIIIQYKYLVLFPLAAFEGPIVSLVVGFLIRFNYLNFWLSYIILLFGDIIPDTAYYYLGRFGNKTKIAEKYFSKGGFIFKNLVIVDKLWQKHPRKTMFLSKLAYGLSTPFLISSGLVGMSFKKFISLTIPITIIQYGLILGIGFFLGHSYEIASKYIDYGGFVIAGLLVLIVVIYFLFSRYAKKQIEKMEK